MKLSYWMAQVIQKMRQGHRMFWHHIGPYLESPDGMRSSNLRLSTARALYRRRLIVRDVGSTAEFVLRERAVQPLDRVGLTSEQVKVMASKWTAGKPVVTPARPDKRAPDAADLDTPQVPRSQLAASPDLQSFRAQWPDQVGDGYGIGYAGRPDPAAAMPTRPDRSKGAGGVAVSAGRRCSGLVFPSGNFA